ncbi:ATP-binding protein [Clostridium sp. CS001]|uniref:AAA family ATPase n=1 Tax=Clostridium sp. CS001 TaxID=2880648 RepID=UPI001CF1482B|nr:ATP-binding protein [Clostridium sp. CS001]MCB2289449.1 ATP-binding protein [Clostridium sp. CS001]
MLIEKIRIDGYKNISNTMIELQDLIALVGLNNYGKSNIIESIDFAHKFIKETPNGKLEMMQFVNAIPLNIKTADKNFVFEIEYTTEFEKKDICINYEFEFEWPKNNGTGAKIIGETLKIKDNVKGQKFNTHISRHKGKSFYKSSETGRCDKNILIEDDNLIVNKLTNYDDLFYVEVIKELTNLRFEINLFLDTVDAFGITPIRMKGNPIYKLDKRTGNNIAEIVDHLRRDDNYRYELLINSFLDLFPNITNVEVMSHSLNISDENRFEIPEDAPFTIVEKFYTIRVKEHTNNQYMNFENLSNGTKRIFILLTAAILADKDKVPLIAFEELEDCIHPKLFQQLIMILTQVIQNCRIIITSHSPFLIQYLDLKKIYISVPSDDGIAIFRKIKKLKQKTIENRAANLNISTGSYIFEMLINYYEDEEESNLCSLLECD